MATEADIPQFIHTTKKEGEGGDLSSEPLKLEFNEFHQEEVQKIEHRHKESPENLNIGERENMQVATNINVNTANAVVGQGDVGTVEDEVYIEASSVPQVTFHEISSTPMQSDTVEHEKGREETSTKTAEESTEHSEQSFLIKTEAGKEKPERSLDIAQEDMRNGVSSQHVETTTDLEKRGSIENSEEILKTTYQTDDIEKESSEEKNLSQSEKIECEEDGNPEESANDSRPLVNETEHLGGEKHDQDSSAEPKNVDEPETTSANECSREHVQLEENKIEDQAGEENAAESSKNDEEMEEVPKEEVSEILRKADTENNSTTRDIFTSPDDEETNEEASFQKESNDEVPEAKAENKDTTMPAKKETDNDNEYTDSIEENSIQEIHPEAEKIEENKAAQPNVEAQVQSIEELDDVNLSSLTASDKNFEENVNENETEVIKSKEEDNNSGAETIEKILGTTCVSEETKTEIHREDNDTGCITGSSNEITKNLVESSSVPHVYEEETGEEVLHKAENPVTWLKEVNPESRMQSENYDLVSDTCEPDGVNAVGNTIEATEFVKNENIQIQTSETDGVDEVGGKEVHETESENHDPSPKLTDETEGFTAETLHNPTSEENVKDPSAAYVSTLSPSDGETAEDNIVQVQEKFMDPEFHADEESMDVEMVNPNEGEVHDDDQQLQVTPALNAETTIIVSEGEELPESTKTGESSHVGELETSRDDKSQNTFMDALDNFEDENPVKETSVEEFNESMVTKEAILCQENFKVSSDEDVEIEKSVVEVERGGCNEEVDVSETKCSNETAEEVPVTTEEDQHTITPVIEESEIDKEFITQSIEQKVVQESSQEVQTRVDNESDKENMETKNQTTEEIANIHIPSSISVENTNQESLEGEERDVLESTQEIKNSGMEKMEQNFDTDCTSEDTKDKTLIDRTESDIQSSAATSMVLPNETNEDVSEKSTVPHVHEEQILHKAETTVTEEKEVLEGEKPQEYTLEDNHKEPHMLSTRELSLTPDTSNTIHEEQLQIKDESTYLASTELEKGGEDEIVYEDDQQLQVTADLDMKTDIAVSEEVELPKSIKASEVLDSGNTGKTEIPEDENLLNTESEYKVEDQMPADEGSNEACETSTEIKKAILEEDHPVSNFKSSLEEDVNTEKEVDEVEAGGHIQETEVPERKSTSTVKDEETEDNKSAPANTETEGTAQTNTCSPTIAEEEEKDVTESKDEVMTNSDREPLEENFNTRCHAEDTSAETLKEEEKPYQDSDIQSTTDTAKVTPADESSEDLVENTSVPYGFEKETGDEILHESETIITGVTEEAVVEELDCADIKYAQVSEFDESKNVEILRPKSSDERDVSTGETLHDFILEQDPKEPYATSSSEQVVLTTEEVHDDEQYIPARHTEEGVTESGHVELLKISEAGELAEFSNIGQVEKFDDEKWLSVEAEKDKLEDPVNKTSSEACHTSVETEQASQEQEHSATNAETSLKEDAEVCKEAVELKAGEIMQEVEVSETSCTSTVTEENPESVETQEQPRSDFEPVTEEQSNEVASLSDDTNVTATIPKEFVLGENKNMEILSEAKEGEDESEEKPDDGMQQETCDSSSNFEDEREAFSADRSFVYTTEQNPKDSPTVLLEEHNHVTTEASETADEPPEKVEASPVDTYTPSAADIIEDKLLQKQVDPTSPRDEAYLTSLDTEKSSLNEEVHGEDPEMYKARALSTEKIVSESTESSGVTTISDIGNLETLPVRKPLNDELDEEAEKTVTDVSNEASDTSMEIETVIVGQIKDSKPPENPEVTTYSDNKETTKSEAAEYENNKTCSEINNTNTEESSKSFNDLELESVAQQVIGDEFQECQREPESEATNQSKETLVENETIKDVMLNEEVSKEVEEAEESENINRQMVEEEIKNKMKNPDQTPIGNLEAADSSETAETLELQESEDVSGEPELDMEKDKQEPVSSTASELEPSAEQTEEPYNCDDKTDNVPMTLNHELEELDPIEQVRCKSELEVEDQSVQALQETNTEEDIDSVKHMSLESTRENIIEQDIQEGGTELPVKLEPTLEPENQSEETEIAIEKIKDDILTEEVSVATEESENVEEEITTEQSCILEHQIKLESNEMITDSTPIPTDNLEATVSCESTETVKALAAEDLDLDSEQSSNTKEPDEDRKKSTEESIINNTSSVSAISEDTFEEENAKETDGCSDETHIAPVTMVTEDTTAEDVRQEEKSTRDFDKTSDDKTHEVQTTSIDLQEEKVDSEKLEDNTGILSPLTAEGAREDNESENTYEVEEAKTSDAISQSKEKYVEDIPESHQNPIVDDSSKPNPQGVIASEVILHQTLPSGTSTEQVQQQSFATPLNEENDETTSKAEKIEDKDENLENEISESSFATSTEKEACLTDEEPRELEGSDLKLESIEDFKDASPDESPKEENMSLGEATSVELQENVSKINFVDFPSENDKSLDIEKTMDNDSKEASEEDTLNSINSNSEAMDLPSDGSTVEVDEKCQVPSTLDFQKNEKALESVSREEAAESEETELKEEQNITETTEPEAKEHQSGIASESITNEITEKEFAKDSPVGSPDKETVGKDVQLAEEYPGDEKLQELNTITDAIQNEKLSEELQTSSLDEDKQKQVLGKDVDVEKPYQDSVADRVANEELQDEAETNYATEAPVRLDIEKMNDDDNCRDTNTGATALNEEVNNSLFMVAEHEEGKESAINKEILTTHDVVADALAEEAPPKVLQEVEEICEVPKEPIHEKLQAYDVKTDIEEEHINISESLKDDEKPDNTTLDSTFDARDITDCLSLKERSISLNEARSSSPIEPVQKEAGDILDVEPSNIISEKQITTKEIVLEDVKFNKDETECTKDEEEVDPLKRETKEEFDGAKIHSTVSADGDVETQDQSGKCNVLSHDKDSSVEITETCKVDLVPDKDVQVEPYPTEMSEPMISSGSKDMPQVQQEPNKQIIQESEDIKSVNASVVEPEVAEVERKEEIIADEDQKKETEELDMNSLPDLLERSTKETSLVIEQRETKEIEADKAETTPVDEEKEDEHERVDSGSDGPVMVEASSDIVTEKVAPFKKSHNILSGVGSKVKHSIAKVKKVITGKSSHPKPSSPK